MRPGRVAALAAGGALALSGCGGDEGASDPAALAPASALLYADAVVRPEGDEREAIESAASALTGSDDVGALVVEQVNALLAEEDAGFTYEADVEPWLGERAGLFLLDLEDDADGALLLSSTDDGAAQEAIEKAVEAGEGGTDEATYEGVDYRLDRSEGDAAAIVEGFVVIGTEAGLKAAVDASRGDSLEDDDGFQEDLDALAAQPVARGYADLASALDEAEAEGELDPDDRDALESLLPGVVDSPLAVAASAEDERVSLETSVGTSEAEDGLEPPATELLGELPADSWAALGLAEPGDAVEAALERGARTDAELERELRSEAGEEIVDALGRVGDVAAFARGASIFEAGGGIVIESLDPGTTLDAIAATRRALSRDPEIRVRPLELEGSGDGFSVEIPDAPSLAHVAQRGDRVVIAYGDEAAERALEPTETLAGSASYEDATDALGEELEATAYLDFAPLSELLGQIPPSVDPELAEARPYLERLGYLILGVAREDDRDIARATLGLEGG